MGLPGSQQRVLERIEGRIARSDPRLEALFAIFTRLSLAEAMPWIEQVKARPFRYYLTRLAAWFRRLVRRPATRARALVVVIPTALVAMALTIAFGFSGSQRPSHGTKTPVARELIARQGLCRLGLVRVPVLAC
jgi:hypothetical protein